MYEMADFEGSCQSTVYRVQCGNTDTIDFSGNESQNTPNFHKLQASRRRRAAFWITGVYLLVVSVTRTALKISKSVVLEETDYSSQNTSLLTPDALVTNEQLKSGGHYRLTDIIYCLLSTLHWAEYGLLIYGFYSFFCSASAWEEDFKQRLGKKVQSHIFKKHRLSSLVTLVILLLFFGVSLANPILSIIHAHGKACNHQADLNCSAWNELIFRVITIYQVFTIVAHIHITLMRFTMAIAVVVVYVIWFDKELYDSHRETVAISNPQVTTPLHENRVEGNEPSASEHRKSEWEIASQIHYKCLDDYNKRREKVVPILDIYQQWFVVQWVIYYFGLLTDLTHLLKPLIARSEGALSSYSYIQISFYIMYSLLAFGIPYVCGLKMSVYHRVYHKKLRKKQLSKVPKENFLQHALAHVLTIEKQRACDFVPHIKWTGINIPIDGPGFTLCSLLTIFGFAAAIVGFS